jgi:small subunit ribosomal protein S20
MPHTRSAKKNQRQSLKRRSHNRATKRSIKDQIRSALDTAKSGSVDELTKQYKTLAKQLDKAAARRIIHPNLAARKKSQVARVLHAKQKSPQAAS